MRRFGAPYFGIHRADLQKTLGAAFGAQNLHLGCRLVDLVEQRDGVVLQFANGRVEHADLVVGADGVRSTVRRWVTGADDAIYSGTSAFRGIVPTENLPSLPDPHAIQFWMGPDAHLLHYAIGGAGELVNFFAVVESPRFWPHDGSVAEVPDDVPVASFRGWHPAVNEMIRAAASPIRWGLFAVRPLLRWYRGRVVVLGDAAHGMLPHHGQGANTSIEDAFALGALLADAGSNVADLLPVGAVPAGQPAVGEQLQLPPVEQRVHLRVRALPHLHLMAESQQDLLHDGGGDLVERLVDPAQDDRAGRRLLRHTGLLTSVATGARRGAAPCRRRGRAPPGRGSSGAGSAASARSRSPTARTGPRRPT